MTEALKRENILIMQCSKLTLWITNPSGGEHKFYYPNYKVFYPRICSWNKNILSIESSANKWDKLMYGWICLNYMMICKTKYIEDLMLVYIFLSITLREGGKFTIKRAKHLFRLIKLQPGKYLFRLLAESSFFVHTPSV